MTPAEFSRQRAKIAHTQGKSQRWRERAMWHLVRDAHAVVVMANSQLVGWQMQNGQIVCVKQRYRNQETAEQYLVMIAGCGGADSRPVRAYHCQHCGGYHLTSRV